MNAQPMSQSADSPGTDARGIGERLRAAREARGFDIAQVATKLHMPAHVIEALEREDWSVLGAAVFVRGQLRSYARLLGLDEEQALSAVGTQVPAPVELVPQTYTPRLQRFVEQARTRLVYVVLTATIVVPVWLTMNSHMSNGSRDAVPLDGAPAAEGTPPAEGGGRAPPRASVAAQRPAPLVASMAPLPSAPAASGGLVVRFQDESWVSLNAPDGSTVEQALVPAGSQRSFALDEIGRVTLGNATQVQVTLGGRPVDLTPFIRANVARFTVSSDGSLQPVGR